MRKKVIKAHRGMAHVPRADGADRSMRKQGPTKGRGRPPTGGRMIGLPQTYRGGGRRNPFGSSPKIVSGTMKKVKGESQSLPAWARKASGGRRVPKPPKPSIKPVTPPLNLTNQPTVNTGPRFILPSTKGQKFPKPVFEKPNRGRRFLKQPNDVAPPPTPLPTPSESVKASAPQTLRPILPQVRYKGGYVSRAKYGQVNNLKKKK